MILLQTLWRAPAGAEFPKISTSMKAKLSHQAVVVMSTSLRVSPSIHGYHFDTASRKKAVGNIFENIDQESLQRLFKNSGDKKAEERAKIIFAIDQDLEEKTRALMALKKRTKDKLFQFLKLRKYSIKVH
ncbi:transcriptional and immune response regulator [Pteropus alecto]|uniref:Transcriptional and immune response regulator n=4 Tax=Laurasiatheria TaxID=314145 RepID=A0A6P3QW88_PTEVA|nr:transcriptional and immune response regulator [Pteropus alecto]XP_011370939.2 transcriptional and immune response regulator [Pteropus vampyrus]XP_039709594.1 transcriptional and immune response regulator [Pteropus giganteus]